MAKYTRTYKKRSGNYRGLRFAEVNETNIKMIEATTEFLNRGRIDSTKDEKSVKYAQEMFRYLMRQATAIEG